MGNKLTTHRAHRARNRSSPTLKLLQLYSASTAHSSVLLQNSVKYGYRTSLGDRKGRREDEEAFHRSNSFASSFLRLGPDGHAVNN
jgi:hypothetical protein